MKNRLNEIPAEYIHKNVGINPAKILKLYTQIHHCRLDFGV